MSEPVKPYTDEELAKCREHEALGAWFAGTESPNTVSRRLLATIAERDATIERLTEDLATANHELCVIGLILDNINEFGHPVSPDGALPPLANDVHCNLAEAHATIVRLQTVLDRELR